MPSAFLRPRPLLAATAALAVAALALGWYALAPSAARTAPAAAAVSVVVVPVERRDVVHRLAGIGTVRSLQTVVVRPQVSAVLVEMPFVEGDLVDRSTLLARLDDREIRAAVAAAEADLAGRGAQLRIATLDLERYRANAAQGVVPRQTLERQAALVEQLQAGVGAAEAALESRRAQLAHTRIHSPVRGRIGLRRVDPGNVVQAGDPAGLVTVTQMDPISVVFPVPQTALGELSGLPAGARVVAYDREAGTALAEGRVATLDNEVDQATGTLRVRARFDNPGGRLWPGQFVAVQLETHVSRDAVVVPSRAVGQGLDGPFVWRIRDGRAEVVKVAVSYRDDEIAVVGEALAAGDSIVVDGQSRLKPNAAVEARPRAVPVRAAR